MAAATPLYLSNTVSATQGGDAIAGLLTVREQLSRVRKEKKGDGKQIVYDHVGDQLNLTLTFSNVAAAHDYMAKSEGNLVVTSRKVGGTTKVCTIKNVLASGMGKTTPDLQTTAIGEVSVEATASYGDSDTYATMVVYSDPS